MIGIKKLFTSVGITGVKDIAFKDIYNQQDTGINLIYISDYSGTGYNKSKLTDRTGYNFIQNYSKKSYFYNAIIPMNFMFYTSRIKFNNYYKIFKSKVQSKVRVIRKFNTTKGDIKNKSNFYDLTALYDGYFGISVTSINRAVKELLTLLNGIYFESTNTMYRRDTYVLLDLDTFGNRKILMDLIHYARVNDGLFTKSLTGIKGILVHIDDKFYPLTKIIELNESDEMDKQTSNPDKLFSLGIDFSVFNRIKKLRIKIDKTEIVDDLIPEVVEQGTESLKQDPVAAKETVYKSIERRLIQIDKSTKDLKSGIDDDQVKVINKLVDKAQNEVMRSKEIQGTSIEDKLENLLDDPRFSKYKKAIQRVKEINLKYNGVIEINEANLKKSSFTYYDPIKHVGIKNFTAYNKQKTEFDEVLDEAMMDLFKGIEQDKEAGIKIMNSKIYFEDNFKSRFKVYKLKLKNTKFGRETPYNIELKVPYPVNGKYLKIDNNSYIMINQFFPQPIIKIDSNIVRMYTHFSTAAVELKGTSMTKGSDLTSLKHEFLKIMTEAKKLKSNKDIPSQDIQKIKDEYNLPDRLNDSLLFNCTIGT